ncbi:MAG: pirin family protein [Phycisphaerae bacterium]|nr:pirin family protein [Phycisphaerae bacterium]
MFTLHAAADRGRTEIGWLSRRHTFSFGGWFDAKKMGFRALRVINDDRVSAGAGFGTHGHRDMEIVTVVLEGTLSHRDSLGHEQALFPGEVQAMTAGSGIEHSEFNGSSSEPAHFLQVRILPARLGTKPNYGQRLFAPEEQRGWLRRVVSGRDADRDGALAIGQDVDLWLGSFRAGERAEHVLAAGRAAYVHAATGSLRVNGQKLSAGDGAEIVDESSVLIEADATGGPTDGQPCSQILVFDLA